MQSALKHTLTQADCHVFVNVTLLPAHAVKDTNNGSTILHHGKKTIRKDGYTRLFFLNSII